MFEGVEIPNKIDDVTRKPYSQHAQSQLFSRHPNFGILYTQANDQKKA